MVDEWKTSLEEANWLNEQEKTLCTAFPSFGFPGDISDTHSSFVGMYGLLYISPPTITFNGKKASGISSQHPRIRMALLISFCI
jgi:hypothetical protein